MNRADFQELSRIRIAEAKVLLDQGKWDGAYYLAGYAVECALKACIAKLTRRHDFPPDKSVIDKCYTHEIMKLITAAELTQSYQHDIKTDLALSRNWGIVKDWNEASRYQRVSQLQAEQLYDAIADRQHGVLRWLKRHW